jgi:copper chaperone CopZ
MGAVYSHFGARNLFVYLATLIIGSMVGGLVFDGLIAVNPIVADSVHHEHVTWFSMANGILLTAILVWCAGTDIRRMSRIRSRKRKGADDGNSSTYRVSGMTCQNCVARLESRLKKIPNVSSVAVDLSRGLVVVTGPVDADTVRLGIRAAGFDVQ